jgi:hypothetical protein
MLPYLDLYSGFKIKFDWLPDIAVPVYIVTFRLRSLKVQSGCTSVARQRLSNYVLYHYPGIRESRISVINFETSFPRQMTEAKSYSTRDGYRRSLHNGGFREHIKLNPSRRFSLPSQQRALFRFEQFRRVRYRDSHSDSYS